MPEAFGQNEQVESQEVKSESVTDISTKANKQTESLLKESEKLKVDVDLPKNPENVFQYESAQEAQKVLKLNPDLKDVVEKGEGVSMEGLSELAQAFAQVRVEVSDQPELSSEEITAMEEEVKYLTDHPDELALSPSLM